MAYDGKDVRSLVEELEQQGFQDLKTDHDLLLDQVHTARAYSDTLIAGLHPSIQPRIAVPSRRLNYAANLIVGLLRATLQFHVDPTTGLKRDDAKADDLELYYANAWATALNPGNRLSNAAYRDQSVGPFSAWWLDYVPLNLPDDEDKRQQAREDYCPGALFRVDPLSVLFLTDDNGEVTYGARHYVLSVMEVIKRYGQEVDKRNSLTIFEQQFGWLRGGISQNDFDGRDTQGKSIEVWVTDDGVNCCHSVRTTAGLYDPNGKEFRFLDTEDRAYPNHWGRPSLFIITGSYNPDGRAPAERYHGLIKDLAREQKTVDIINTYIASTGLMAPRWLVELSDKVIEAATDGDAASVSAITAVKFDANGVGTVAGKPTELRNEMPEAVKELLVQAISNRDALWPNPFLTGSNPDVVKEGTAAGVLNAHESADKLYDKARNSFIAGVVDVTKAIRYFWRNEDREKAYARLSGSEGTSKYQGERKGEVIELDKSVFEMPHNIEIRPIAETDGQKQLRYQLKRQQVLDGVATPEQLIETVTEDVQGQVEKLEIHRRVQQRGPVMDKMGLIASIEAVKLATGRDYSQLFLMSQGQQPGDPEMEGQGGPAVQRTDPPVMSTSAVEVTG